MTAALPASAWIEADDGAVSVRRPDSPDRPWLAFTLPSQGQPSAVLWREEPELWLCAEHGYALRADLGCEHMWAAVNAQHDLRTHYEQ